MVCPYAVAFFGVYLETLICAITNFWQDIFWMFCCSFFMFFLLSVWCTFRSYLLRFGAKTCNVLPRCSSLFQWFSLILPCSLYFLIVLAEFYMVFIHFSIMLIDFWIDLRFFYMIFNVFFITIHWFYKDDVASFLHVYGYFPTEFIDVSSVFINCHVFVGSCMVYRSLRIRDAQNNNWKYLDINPHKKYMHSFAHIYI